ncbi:hypothetical protein, partial [Sphingomonas sp. PP-CE-1G-424]|uniref:hypothetical protein n=1 Tax=Sphingomonas sp. PP-CE-1G-424 TaxID=2135658 RepID=UPI001056A59B
MSVFVWIIILGGLGWMVTAGIKLKKQHDAEDNTFVGEHQGWDIYKSAHDRGVLALDHEHKRIAIGTITNHVERSWSDLLPRLHAIGKLARQMETSDAARPIYRGSDHWRAARA